VVADLRPDTDPAVDTHRIFAEVLAGVLGVEIGQVSVDSHFFEDLGADSMVMAQFCARVRKRTDLPSVSMKDIYRHPTITGLATAFAEPAPAATGSPVRVPAEAATVQPADGDRMSVEPVSRASTAVKPAGNRQYVLCGALQLLIFLGYSYFAAFLVRGGYEWISAASGPLDIYRRAVVFGTGSFITVCTFPILVKWVLIGRWTPREIPVWSLAYVRFWIVKTLIWSNPLALLFAGTPIYPFYLRALGAKIGRGAAIFSRSVPVCTDLLTIGAGTVIGKQSSFLCYRAHDGRIQTGAVTLGKGVLVGEKTVLEINSSMGDGAQLGHTSALHSGQAVPTGQRWHGSPAVPTEVNYARIAPAQCGRLRQLSYSAFALLRYLLLYLPLTFASLYLLLAMVPPLAALLAKDFEASLSPTLYLDALVLSLALFAGGLFVGLLALGTVPRLLNLLITPDKVYPLYGFHYGVHRMMMALTNRRFFTYLFGDSSVVVHYFRWLGYRLGHIVQTGANFGLVVTHDNPHLTSVGSGTMVADGLLILNTDLSSTSFRMSQVSIGKHNFLGNDIAYPAGGRTGDNCLIGTKAMVPLEGRVHEGVGLLGSPCFEIPRSVARDSRFAHLATGEELRRRLARKNRYDLRTMGLYLFVRWVHTFLLFTLGLVAVDFFGVFAEHAAAAFFAVSLGTTLVYFLLAERAVAAFQRLQPQYCSIYEPYFWWHERYWKLSMGAQLRLLTGTPFKNLASRLQGARVGHRVFDDGCGMPEPTLITIGDDCTLNNTSVIQCHSQEDSTFKSDRVTIGAGCTLGVGALVHYGTTMGDGSVLAADSFLMKGEEIPPLAQWGGNPAREISA
jgi:non-ribosomal peptide synthetase-like protein